MDKAKINRIDSPSLIRQASTLKTTGKLSVINEKYVYLDIDDEYIHQLYPLLHNSNIKKPDYFGPGLVGAHISVIYPEENIIIDKSDLDHEHTFEILYLFSADLGIKRYYAVMVNTPSLLSIRRKYGLSDLLPFKGYFIGFHITIGVQPI